MKKEGGPIASSKGVDSQTQNISNMFEDPLQNEIFKERCHDTGDSTTSKLLLLSFSNMCSYFNLCCSIVENAKIFKEEFLKRNVKTQQGILNL